MKRVHAAILVGQLLSYSLILTFIFANQQYQLTSVFGVGIPTLTFSSACLAACLVGLVGTINMWLTWYYISKSDTIRDMLVVCAWTGQVKSHGKWIPLDQFLTQQLGYAVSHGLSDSKLAELRAEIDRDWKRKSISKELAPEVGKETELGGSAQLA